MIHLLDVKDRFNIWKYNCYASGTLRPSFDPSSITYEGYCSQCGQDKWLIETLLPHLKKGVFVDVGAHDGISFSNTYFLERQLEWSGIAIEPIPEIFEKLKANRKCQVINGCISSVPGKAKFYRITGYAEMLSGLYNEYDSRHLMRIQREIQQHGGSVEVQDVMSFSFNQLLHDHQIFHIDYLNIDVEGAELSILKSIDFKTFDISVISCENNYRDYRIPKFLKKAGYTFHSVVGDEFYIKDHLFKSYNSSS